MGLPEKTTTEQLNDLAQHLHSVQQWVTATDASVLPRSRLMGSEAGAAVGKPVHR